MPWKGGRGWQRQQEGRLLPPSRNSRSLRPPPATATLPGPSLQPAGPPSSLVDTPTALPAVLPVTRVTKRIACCDHRMQEACVLVC